MNEHALAPTWDGSVVLDIGGDIGALVLRTSAAACGSEIDLMPDEVTAPHVHSAVRERRTPQGSSFAAVYPQLASGWYTIEGSSQRLSIEGGRVSEVTYVE